jgi:hypothetical protein
MLLVEHNTMLIETVVMKIITFILYFQKFGTFLDVRDLGPLFQKVAKNVFVSQ